MMEAVDSALAAGSSVAAAATIAFTAAGGQLGDVLSSSSSPVPVATPGSIEEIMVSAQRGTLFVDLRSLPVGHTLTARRRAVPGGYVPSYAEWTAQVDGIVLIPEMAPATRASQR
jgi:hypothetical protein